MEKILNFEVHTSVDVDIEEVANTFEVWLDDWVDENFEYEKDETIAAVKGNKNKILKAVAKYWLKNLE